MKLILLIVLVPIALIVVIAAIAFGVGYSLPENHVARRTALIPAPPDSVWRTITDIANYPSWRSDVKKVEMLRSPNGRIAWREGSGGDAIPMEMMESEPPTRLVVRIASDSLPFGGTWTYSLVPRGSGTEVTITEAGVVRHPLFRFVSRYVMGHTKTIDDYLHALGRKFGADVVPSDPATP